MKKGRLYGSIYHNFLVYEQKLVRRIDQDTEVATPKKKRRGKPVRVSDKVIRVHG